MEYPLKQYQCNVCGELSDVLDCDQPLPKGWTIESRFIHYCPKCSYKKIMMEKRNDEIKEAAKEHSDKLTDVLSFIQGALWADKHPDAISMNYLQSWYQCSIDETQEPIWTDKHLEELYEDFYLIPKEK